MAAREGQGLQIAVIIFAMLTIILAITTYVFYAQSQTAYKEADSARASLNQEKTASGNLRYENQAMRYVLGIGNVTEADIDAAKNSAGGGSAEVETILTNFKADMDLIGSQVAADQAKNYRTMQQVLLAAVQKKNSSVTDANNQTRAMQQQEAAAAAAAAGKVKAAEDSAQAAAEDANKARTEFVAAVAANDKAKQEVEKQLATITTKNKADLDKAAKENEALIKQTTDQQQRLVSQRDKLDEYEKQQVDLFENPDGKIVQVSQRQRLVWLNVGRADGLMRQTTFSVYPHDENGVASAEAKARLEVVRVDGEHMAEAKILEDSASDPILPGDIVHTPTWSPGQRIHFAMAGKMDINGDGIDDYDLVRNVILVNGGVIDAELKPDGTRSGNMTVSTRYLVLGNRPDEAAKDNPRLLTEFSNMITEQKNLGIDEIQVQKLLEMMGWKSEERTVELAGSRGGVFRKRAPGKAQPTTSPAPAGDATAPATEAPGPGGEVDPFGAGAATDPFGTPEAAPDPTPMPAEADPFATP